ncbi:MAG: putative CheA signal transduction histidine kinase [Panacagrimonas sp.]|nr:Hpt domain-containing protein [Panacagrimonas sp.]MCC2656590.1 putative CheA signal transduction histidine kinase [Panacagrimonas sp.]
MKIETDKSRVSQLDIHNATRQRGVAAGLHWVRGELNENLLQASQLVELHAEHTQDPTPLNKALAHLHEVRGAAVLIQAYGLALLAEEMKQTVQDLATGHLPDPNAAYSAVVGACVQATDYLDLLQNGQNDSALVLQPIVNELRLARGKSLLTEDDLFVAQFRVLGLHLERESPPSTEFEAQAEAAKLHPVFSASLLAWFKDQDLQHSLSRIGRISEILADACRERPLHQLWRTAAACIEALLSRALDDSLELKRQFGRAGQLMKILAEVGEAGAVKQMSDVSLRLLFYVGRSGGAGSRVLALREGLQLETWLPTVDVVQACRARLRGANTGLLVRVAEELRADLAEVRDSIDVALRAGASPEEFESTADRLKRVADTLLVLGLSAESQALAQPVETLREAGASDPAAWMEFATAVLQVDLSLEAALYRQLQSVTGMDPAAGAASASKPVIADLREGMAALLRESLVNLARVKGYVEAYVRTGDVLGLPEAVRLIDEIAAGFRMLTLDRAEALALDVQRFLQSPDFSLVRESNTAAGRFADAIAAIEYYIELRRDGSGGTEQVLDKLEEMVLHLTKPAPSARVPVEIPDKAAEPAIEAAPAAPAAGATEPEATPTPAFELGLMEYVPPVETVRPAEPPAPIPAPEFHLVGAPLPEPPEAAPAPAEVAAQAQDVAPPVEAPVPEPVVAGVAAASPAPSEVDPEIRQIFIDEAEEVLQTLQRAVPRWLRQTDERDVLATIRRAFHTLKGSGRMVGALDIGEFSWAIENMLNRCLDRTIEQSPPVLDTVRDALAMVPGLIGAFRDGTPPPPTWSRLAEQARRLAASQPLEDENDLVAVFRSDAKARLQMIMRWVRDQVQGQGEYGIPEPVLRALHTLRGAGLAIGARAVGELAGSLENYLDTLHRAHLGLPHEGLTLIDEACQALDQWIGRVGDPSSLQIDVKPWLDRVEAVRAGAEGESGTTDEDHQLAEVFAFEALDLVQKFESDLLAWSRAPQATGHARALKATVHTLKGAAGMAQCAPMVAVAQGLNLRLGAMGDVPSAPPPPAFFQVLKSVVEGLYTQLDQFRDGKLGGDGSEWLSLLDSLDAVTPAAAHATPTPAVTATPAPDRELAEIFLHEGEELVEELEQLSGRIVEQLGDATTLGSWLRALHTLKGSARVAGIGAIGEVAHRLETATEAARAEGADGRARFGARMRVAVDGLHGLIDAVRAGQPTDAGPILGRFDAALAPTPAFFEPRLDEPAAAPEEPLLPDAPDAELIAIFEPEALELLESLDNAMSEWRERPADPRYSREMQRQLHTFKGGARMAGLRRLGDAAHALESELVALDRAGGQLGAPALQGVALQLDALHRMYEAYTLTDNVAPAPVMAPEPVASEPEPQAPPEIAVDEATGIEPVLEPVEEPAETAPAEPELADVGPDRAMPPPVEAPVFAPAPMAVGHWNPDLFWRPAEAASAAESRREAVRVPVERLDGMLNQAGEISIYRARLEENHASLGSSLEEMAQTITRVREQLRLMEVETEAQIAARGFARDQAEGDDRYESQFDALEMDRYSRMQELSRALAESVSDMSSLHASLDTTCSEAEGLLQQQGRLNTEVQQALMGTLMVPFSRQVQRLSRVVRQTAEQNGKKAQAEFSGAESELDRNVLERMTAPLEHLLRNSVVHGIEDADTRRAAGKPPEGTVHIALKREGSQLLIEVRDDGRGLDFDAIRAQAVKKGLMRPDAEVPLDDLARFIFTPGFSTARALTQDAGRGIGMDVVAAEVKQLGGTVDVASEPGKGARFRVRLPLMLAVSQALVVQVGEELFAIPLSSVEGIARAPRESLAEMMKEGGRPLDYGGHQYQVRRLGELVGLPAPARIDSRTVPAILLRLGDGLGGAERRVAVVAERLIGNREIVTKPAGPILGSVTGISGATILADGRVMLIVDIPALISEATRRRLGDEAVLTPVAATEAHRLIMVVDDSITIRRVTERLLTRKGYRVITAKDGLDAMATLQTEAPDAVLLDIEMPRADGFEVAAFIRNTPRIAKLPIIMITSRSGDKHREHARSLGVNKYLIKPYQEDQLLAELSEQLAAHAEAQSA